MVIQFFFPTFEGTLIKLYIYIYIYMCVFILYKKKKKIVVDRQITIDSNSLNW